MTESYNVAAYREEFERSFTWHRGFLRNVRRFGDRTALIDPIHERRWTYAELNADCCRLANALRAAGLGPGDVLLYQLPNSPAFAFCYVAPQKLGAVNSPASFNLAPGETAYLLEQHRPKVYVYDTEQLEAAARALEISRFRPDCVVAVDFRGKRPALPEGHVFYEDFVAPFGPGEPEREEPENMYEETTRLFTSGTTGMPKGVPLCAANELLSAHDVIMHYPLNPRDVTMNMTPWFHRGGLHSGGLTPTLYAGASAVILRAYSARTCLDTAVKYGVTFLTGVPAVLNNLALRQEKHPVDLSAVKGVVTMGSPLEKQDCARYRRLLSPNSFNGDGTTETFWNRFLRPWELPEMAGTAGRSCTDDEVRVVRMAGEGRAEPEDVVPTDGVTEGEIIISAVGKSTLSYYKNPEAAAAKFYKGWLYTGDVGVWDARQFITVRGRRDDMMICGGENIYPVQIEEVLNRHPAVADCLVTGVKDTARGEAIVAYVVKAAEVTIRELIAFCAASPDLPDYKCPRWYRFVEELPFTATGKKRHAEMKKQALRDLEAGLLSKY